MSVRVYMLKMYQRMGTHIAEVARLQTRVGVRARVRAPHEGCGSFSRTGWGGREGERETERRGREVSWCRERHTRTCMWMRRWVDGHCRIFNLVSIINIRRGHATGRRLATATARRREGCVDYMEMYVYVSTCA